MVRLGEQTCEGGAASRECLAGPILIRDPKMKKILFLSFLPLLLTSTLAQQIVTSPPADNAVKFHPNRILVRFRGAPQLLPGSGRARVLSQQRNLFLIDNPPSVSVAEAITRYKNNPNVVYAEPDYQVRVVDTMPGDPLWSQQWDMVKIEAPTAWNTQTNAGDVVVAVVDTGIAFSHPDLHANLWTEPGTGGHGFTCISSSSCR